MEKINVAELLKDCPKGMELDCTMYDNVEFDYIEQNSESIYPIHCSIKTNGGYNTLVFTSEGCNDRHPNSKCVIFPKGKTTWEGFAPPCKFEDGDIVATNAGNWIGITTGGEKKVFIPTYCVLMYGEEFRAYFDIKGKWEFDRLATEEEKQKLFQAIKDNGYKWNAETKTLDKLIEPSFKVGDKVRHKNNHGVVFTITSIEEDSYVCGAKAAFWFDDQDDYELVPNKFDISTLKPFDKVLVRNKSNEVWTANFYSHYDATSDKPFICVGWSEMNEYRYCIPYEVNNELLGTTNNTEEYGSR